MIVLTIRMKMRGISAVSKSLNHKFFLFEHCHYVVIVPTLHFLLYFDNKCILLRVFLRVLWFHLNVNLEIVFFSHWYRSLLMKPHSLVFLLVHYLIFADVLRVKSNWYFLDVSLQSKWHLHVLRSLFCSLSRLAIRNLCVGFQFFCSYVAGDLVLVGWCNASLGNHTPAFGGSVMSLSSGVRVSKNFSSIFWPPKIIHCYLKISVTNYPGTQCHMPEELNPQIICRYRHEGLYSLTLQGNWVSVSVSQMFLTGRCLFRYY